MKIARIAPLAYSPGKLEYFSFIRSGMGAEYHQNPNFYVFADGAVMMHWMAYDFDECSNNAVQLYSISKDSGLTWSDPQVFMADYADGVPYLRLLRLEGGSNALMFQVQTVMEELEVDEQRRIATGGANYFNSRARVYLRRSADGGRTFDHGRELPYTDITSGKSLPGVGFYGAIEELVQLRGGRIVAAFAWMDPQRSNIAQGHQHFSVSCLLSDDGGNTWATSGPIIADTPRGVMEPQIVETAPDQLFCLFRTQSGFLYQTRSEDGGRAWSASRPSPLPSPESMPRMIRLASGNLLLAWNPVSSVTQQPRHPMSAAVSSDGGRTWSAPKPIADETGENQLTQTDRFR
jgi:Neuraminidase (sialidase)